MDILTEEESRLVMESMIPPFTRQFIDEHDIRHLSTSGQEVLLIHGPGQQYELTTNHKIPSLMAEREILVKVIAVGLNPIDWKGPDYNFGLPSLPWINGRDLAGVVVKAPRNLHRVKVGDVVLSPSTDYRDIRKAAFQEYVVTTEQNSARVPRGLPIQLSAAVGVAFVTAALALGVCLGVNFSTASAPLKGPDLFRVLREVNKDAFAEDVREECLDGVRESERARPGDWIAIWGASSATGLAALQLAKLANLRTICIVDVARHGRKLLDAGADLLVDRLDTDRTIAIIRAVTNGELRFALDTVGKDTAELLQQCLSKGEDRSPASHLVGLTGLPKSNLSSVVHHKVPIKIFHDIQEVGESLMKWLESLLLAEMLIAPEIEIAVGGLGGVNQALDTLRTGKITGKRVVVPLDMRTAVSS